MATRQQVIAAVGGAFVVIVGGIYMGTRHATVSGNQRVEVAWPDGGAPEGAECVRATGYASPQALALFGMTSDAGPKYVYIEQLCAVPTESEEEAQLPSGMESLEIEDTFQYDGGPQFVAAIDDEAQWPCACSTGTDCERLDNAGNWVSAATWNNIILPGKWRGNGCLRTSCVALAGAPPLWPAGCLPP